MKPLELTLEGFWGVRSGLGKDSITINLREVPESAHLVALVGPNGTSKTTILDNLHPYRLMPSHSKSNTIGSFSYWDHICSPTGKKGLLWEHGNRVYQSEITFRAPGKTKKMDCYLLVRDEATQKFVPVTLADGCTSDGKTETYDRCVSSILGAPETFFMSMFSAQSKRSLSSYRASEIKDLFAGILEQGDLRTLADRANLVCKMLRFELDGLQEALAQSRVASKQIDEAKLELAGIESEITKAGSLEQVQCNELDAARKALTLIEARRDSVAQDVEQRIYLSSQIEKARSAGQTRREKLNAETDSERKRLEGEKSRAANDLTAAKAASASLDEEALNLQVIVTQRDQIDQAAQQLPAYKNRISSLDSELAAAQAKISVLRAIQETLLVDTAEMTKLETIGNSKTEIIVTLKQTAALIDQVPCTGTVIQRQCPLLGNAITAQSGVATQETSLADLRQKYRVVRAAVNEAKAKLIDLPALEAAVAAMTKERNEIADLCDSASRLCGMAAMLQDASKRLAGIEAQRPTAKARVAECEKRVSDLVIHLATIEQKRQSTLREIEREVNAEVANLEERLTKLALPVTETELDHARNAVTSATAALDNARALTHSRREKRNELCGRMQVLANLQNQAAEAVKQADRLTEEIAKWKILEKGLGTNGLIALMIDDAGPEIAMLCNELLHKSYGGRFTVRLDTQRELAGGDVKEDFDVVVTDNHRGEPKSLGLMSGGEKVWVNECLHRAIALYVGQSSGVQYQTLFSDETDGPLDPERKRQHFQMKRAVLARGGYLREYFISQTPEIWEMADHIIDVTTL